MPNGKPGDHPLTDIAVHGMEYFDRETNARIKRLHDGPGGPLLSVLSELIFSWPRQPGRDWTDLVEPDRFRRVVEEIERCHDELLRRGQVAQ